MTGEGLKFKKLRRSTPELYNGEFDPGSERTLAARFKHASRTVRRTSVLPRVADG